jgi:hypothetical protein
MCAKRAYWGGGHACGVGRIHSAPSTKLGMVSLSNHWRGSHAGGVTAFHKARTDLLRGYP